MTRTNLKSGVVPAVLLIAVLAWRVTPVEAQSGATTMTVTLQSLAISVSPSSLATGVRTAGQVFNNVGAGLSAIAATNNGNVNANFQIAGTNARQPSPLVNPTWLLVTTVSASEQFRWGFNTTGATAAFTYAAGPGGGVAFPTTGSSQSLASSVAPGAT